MADERPPVKLVSEDELDSTSRDPQMFGTQRVRLGFDLPESPWDLSGRGWMCAGVVTEIEDAEAALTALVRGVGLLISVQLVGDRRRRFVDDVTRAGSLIDDEPGFGSVEVLLLEALAQGMSLADAARRAFVSRRTANRRMAGVRSYYGVATTAEAVIRWVKDSAATQSGGQADDSSPRDN